MIQLVMSLVITRISYCNSALADFQYQHYLPLWKIQNAATRCMASRWTFSPLRCEILNYGILKIVMLMHSISSIVVHRTSWYSSICFEQTILNDVIFGRQRSDPLSFVVQENSSAVVRSRTVGQTRRLKQSTTNSETDWLSRSIQTSTEDLSFQTAFNI